MSPTRLPETLLSPLLLALPPDKSNLVVCLQIFPLNVSDHNLDVAGGLLYELTEALIKPFQKPHPVAEIKLFSSRHAVALS